MKNLNKKLLNLFNSVVSVDTPKSNGVLLKEHGVFVPENAVYAMTEIKKHLNSLKLSGEELNKSFFESFSYVKNTDREKLIEEQIIHYITNYNKDIFGYIYIPEKTAQAPELKDKIKVYSLEVVTEKEAVNKCLDILCSGIALKEETLKDIFEALSLLKYKFTGEEKVKNKEALVLIADKYSVYPKNPEEFLRYVLLKSIDKTTLIKSNETIHMIENCDYDVSEIFEKYGLEKLSTVFNRFKPIFLAFKNTKNKKVLNKISKLSKKNHKPMVENPLNKATIRKIEDNEMHWLENATLYSIFKVLSACYSRVNGQDHFLYRVRNGKSWALKNEKVNVDVCNYNYNLIIDHLKNRVNGNGKKVYIPENVVYALPTSEKMFVGNIPTGTKILGEKLAVGVYWREEWGAEDLDLSAINIGGKIGWNSDFHEDEHGLTYSGDRTDASDGAVEYMHLNNSNLKAPTLLMNNVYYGSHDSGYKIIVTEGSEINDDYICDPNNVICEVKTNAVQKDNVLGMFLNVNAFVFLNFGSGVCEVSSVTEFKELANKALYQQWKSPLSLNYILNELGYVLEHNSNKNVDFNLSLDIINKSSFIDLFKL